MSSTAHGCLGFMVCMRFGAERGLFSLRLQVGDSLNSGLSVGVYYDQAASNPKP